MTSDLQIKNPQVNIDINRDKASALGITASQIEDALYYAYGSRQVSTIYAPNNQYQVILELEPKYQTDPSALVTALYPFKHRPTGAVKYTGDSDTKYRPPDRKPPRTAPCSHHLL